MKILLAGATGAIGRPLVARLVAAGHEVVGLTRKPDRVAELDAAGARGVVCDVIDRDASSPLADEVRPDVVMDQTTALPQRYDARKMWEFYEGMVDAAPARDAEPHRGRAARPSARIVVPERRVPLRAGRQRPPAHRGRPAVRARRARSRGTSRCRRSSRSSGAWSTSAGSCCATGCSTGPGPTSTTGQSARTSRKRRMPVVGRGTGRVVVHPRRRRRGGHRRARSRPARPGS